MLFLLEDHQSTRPFHVELALKLVKSAAQREKGNKNALGALSRWAGRTDGGTDHRTIGLHWETQRLGGQAEG